MAAGEPGHCLTRSAILATQLLSVGVPARVIQMMPRSGKGHTLVEVWDDRRGWTVVDPSTGGFVSKPGARGSAAELLAAPDRLRWTSFDSASSAAEAQSAYFRGLLTGDLFYPEPWLYLRQGAKVAPWPFRGHYARVGPTLWAYGPAQFVLTAAAAVSTVSGFSLLAFAFAMRRRAFAGIEQPSDARAGVKTLPDLRVVPPA
jgi:hypothetical protein